MTIRLDLMPEVEAYLPAQARVKGVALDAYLEGIIEDLARSEVAPPASTPDLTAVLDALAKMGKGLPILPPSARTRDSIYQDHMETLHVLLDTNILLRLLNSADPEL